MSLQFKVLLLKRNLPIVAETKRRAPSNVAAKFMLFTFCGFNQNLKNVYVQKI